MTDRFILHPPSLWTAFRCRRFLRRRGCLPLNDIPTHLTPEEKLRLYELARGQAGVFVEIGSYLGASASFIALALLERAQPSRLYCVDTWENDAMSEESRDTYQLFEQNVAPFRGVITPLRGESVAVSRTFGAKIDFLFIDGDHSYSGVKGDVMAWSPRLNPGALVVFHDIRDAPGVRQVIREEIAPRARKTGRLPNLYWAWVEP
jgi:predicted O-methyltransferase YrrM